MSTRKQSGPTFRNLLAAALACLILVIGCAGPTAETIATATAMPTLAAVTTTSTETAEPSKFYIEFPVGEGLEKLPDAEDILSALESYFDCLSSSCDIEIFVKEGLATLVLRNGKIWDAVTNTEYSQPVTLVNFGEDIVPAQYKEALLKTEGSDTVALYAMNVNGDMGITGIILHADGVYYKLVVVLNSDGSTSHALKSDLGNSHRLTVDENDPSMLLAEFTTNGIDVVVKIPNPDFENSGSMITVEEAKARALNPLEQMKIEYDVDSANFESSTFFADYKAWQITENNLTNKQTGEKFAIGDYIIFTEEEPVVVHIDLNLDEVTPIDPGYLMEWQTNDQNELKVTAVFSGDPDEPTLVWNPEGGESGNGAWEEETEGYERIFEAMMVDTKEMWNGGAEIPGLSLNAVEPNWIKFINFTPPDQIVLPEGFDPNADKKVVKEFILNNFETIVAIDPITNEIVEVQALDGDGQLQVEIIVISDIGEGIPYYWDLGKNDVVDRVYLPGYMQYNELTNQNGKAFGIYYFPATETQKAKVVLYIVGNYHKYDDRDERQRMGGFAYSMFSPLALFAVPPEEMQRRVLIVPEGARKNNHTLGLPQVSTLTTALQDITKTTEVWKY